MDPLDFLNFADSLKNSAEEAGRRSAISRAYYSVFHYIKAYLEEKGIPIPEDSTAHAKIPQYLRNAGLEEVRELGQSVDDLQEARIDADYSIDLPGPTANTCSLFILKAKMAVSTFDSFKGRGLVCGIRQYLARIEGRS